jgi:hypothetical protein
MSRKSSWQLPPPKCDVHAGFGHYKVISIDYRMPPAAPYPAALDDAMTTDRQELERAISQADRAQGATRLIEAKPAEASKPLGPSPAEVSAERMGKSFQPLRRRL